MQIAQIVVKTRTTKEDVFDYAIPPAILPQIKIGVLVEVLFHGRKIEGIIVGLKRSSSILKLSNIISVIDFTPVVDETHIKLAQWMSEYYLVSLGQTLFENVVPPAKRTLKKIDEKKNFYQSDISRKTASQKFLVIADFNARLEFYLKEITKTIREHKNVILLVPDLSLIRYFTGHLKHPYAIIHAGLTRTERWTTWNNIREGEIKIVIGAQSALFSPVSNLGLVILDQEENETYKSDRAPRFNTIDVAESLCELTSAKLIVGSTSPQVTTYFRAKKLNYKIYKRTAKTASGSIVNMNFEKRIISNTLEEQINSSLSKKNKILLVLNRKGEGTNFSCADCGWIRLCEKCGLPLIPQKAKNVCFRCEKTFAKETICPKCQGINLKPAGLGTARLKKILAKIFPQAKIAIFEKDASVKDNNYDIAIVTSYGLKMSFANIGLVAIVDTDQTFSLPDFSSTEKAFNTYYKFLKLADRKIIQTHLADHYAIQSLAAMDLHQFLNAELSIRQAGNFPPFYKLIRLEYQNESLEKAELESKKVAETLQKINYDHSMEISDPYQPFINKKRNKFRSQILLRTKNTYKKLPLTKEIQSIIKDLPKGWIVDVDPFSLI